MTDNEKNDSIDKSIDYVTANDKNTDYTDYKKTKIKESLTVFYKLQLNELKELLEKEKQN